MQKNTARKKSRTALFAVVALIEILVLLMNVTYSWVPSQEYAGVIGNDLSITASSGVKIQCEGNYSGNVQLNNYTLSQATSVDGRTIFFPTAGKSTKNNNTNEMKFREGNASDVNNNYICVDFTIRADDASAGKTMPVWFDGDHTYVKKNGSESGTEAIRVAFYENNGSTPQVFAGNTAKGQQRAYSPVNAINKAQGGTPRVITDNQQAKAFGDNFFVSETQTGNALFVLQPSEVKHITMIVWLEGTDAACTDALLDTVLNLRVRLRGAVSEEPVNTVRIFFKDNHDWASQSLRIYYWYGGSGGQPIAFADAPLMNKYMEASGNYYYYDIPITYLGRPIGGFNITKGNDNNIRDRYRITADRSVVNTSGSKNNKESENDTDCGIFLGEDLIRDGIVFYSQTGEQDDKRKEWYQGPPT